MWTRITYGIVTLLVLCTLFVLDVLIARDAGQVEGPVAELLQRGSVIPLLFVIVILRAAMELVRLFEAKGTHPHAKFAYLMTTLMLLAPWLSAGGWLGHDVTALEGMVWPGVALVISVIGVAILTVFRGHAEGAMRDGAATLTVIIYLGFLSSFGLQLRCARDTPGEEGAWLLLIILLVTKASDIGAYFTGSAIGRHKLIPAISPGKTVEGAIGGASASALLAVLFAKAATLSADPGSEPAVAVLLREATLSFSLVHDLNGMSPVIRALVFGLVLSVAGQIGDLFESCFKRDAGTKDSGNVIPQYGGILDLVDSPVLAMPVGWFLLTMVWNVV